MPAHWEGVALFKAQLAALSSSLPEMADDVGKRTAVIIAGKARALTPIGPGEGGHARNTIQSTGSTVRGGSANHSYFGWLDFGGAVGRNNSVRRPFLKGGRIIFAAYRADKPVLEERMEDSLETAIRRAGLR